MKKDWTGDSVAHIDGIKFREYLDPSELRWLYNNPNIKWPDVKVTHWKGEVVKEVAPLNGLHIIIFPTHKKGDLIKVKIAGSPHTSSNEKHGEGKQNYNDLTHQRLLEVIDMIEIETNIEAQRWESENLEWGINSDCPIEVEKLLKRHIVCVGGQVASYYNGNDGGYYQFGKGQTITKVYSKGGQFHREREILRFERKCMKRQACLNHGVSTLHDLRDTEVLDNLFTRLIKHFDKAIIVDERRPNIAFTKNETKHWISGVIDAEWKDLTPKKRNRLKGYINRITSKYGLNTIHKEIRQNIIKKWYSREKWVSSTGGRFQVSNDFENKSGHDLHIHQRSIIPTFQMSLFPVSKMNDEHPKPKDTRRGIEILQDRVGHLTYEKGGKYPDQIYSDDAQSPLRKKLRNDESNDRNNLIRSIKNKLKKPGLFPTEYMLNEILGALPTEKLQLIENHIPKLKKVV